MNLSNYLLKERKVVGNIYVYTYVNRFGTEVRIAKFIPRIKEVTIEGDNNKIVLPYIPDKLTVLGSNNTVIARDELDDLVIPSFNTNRPNVRAKGFSIKSLFRAK